ncbi:DciA family protein [Streptomyces sp. NPDC058595]|uniref:DciA family protein n=1 Tax=Streptomyces sp. NPDC058595 TaxID=3346550 RepID=UPI00365B3BF6
MTIPAQPGSTTVPETSGVDLARAALHSAMQAAKRRPSEGKARRVTTKRADRTGGRDPLTLAGAIERMVAERGWKTPVAGGNVLGQWADIAPELAGKVSAERFDADTGTLHLRPASDAYGTQLRLHQARIITTINQHLGEDLVRTIRTLPVGAPGRPAPEPAADPTPHTAAPPVASTEPRPRNPAYLATLAVAREHKPDPIVHPDLTRVVEAQTQALLHGREPETAFSEAVYQQEQARARRALETAQRRPSLEASLAAARRRKRAEEAGSTTAPQTPPLQKTA